LFALAPVVIFTAPDIEQVDIAVPALAVGAVVIVIVFVDIEDTQVPFPVAVNVSALLPAVISAPLGVYVAAVSEVALVNVPVPFDVHNTPD